MQKTSITKQFVAKDEVAYKKLVKKIKKVKLRKVETAMPARLVRGRELLKKFSFRQ
jgi:hypothetical protein